MNKKNLESYIKKEVAHESSILTSEERDRMRSTLHAYMDMKPARSHIESRVTYPTFSVFSWRLASVALAVVVCFSGAGVSYAAQGALPGDFLYSVKTGVNEPLAGALAFGDTEKAQWARSVATERLKEAAILAATNSLTPEREQAIEVSFDDHAAIAIAHSQKNTVDTSTVSAHDATAVVFDGQLQAYEDAFAQIETHTHASSTTLRTAIAQTQKILNGTIASTTDERDHNEHVALHSRDEAQAETNASLHAIPQLAGILSAETSIHAGVSVAAGESHDYGASSVEPTLMTKKKNSKSPSAVSAIRANSEGQSVQPATSTAPFSSEPGEYDRASEIQSTSSSKTTTGIIQSIAVPPLLPAPGVGGKTLLFDF